MDILIESFEQEEGRDEGRLSFEPCPYDVATVLPQEVLEYRKAWQEITLSNDETLSLRTEFGVGYDVMVVVVRQGNTSICSVVASDIVSASFVTMGGLRIGLQLIGDHEKWE